MNGDGGAMLLFIQWCSIVGVNGDGGVMLLMLLVATKERKMVRKKRPSVYVCRNELKTAVSGLRDHSEPASLV